MNVVNNTHQLEVLTRHTHDSLENLYKLHKTSPLRDMDEIRIRILCMEDFLCVLAKVSEELAGEEPPDE